MFNYAQMGNLSNREVQCVAAGVLATMESDLSNWLLKSLESPPYEPPMFVGDSKNTIPWVKWYRYVNPGTNLVEAKEKFNSLFASRGFNDCIATYPDFQGKKSNG